MRQTVAVLGSGSWGTALAMVLHENGHTVRLWGNDPEQINEINHFHTNKRYLPDVTIHPEIVGYLNLKEAIEQVDAILFVVPTNAMRSVARQVAEVNEGNPVVIHASKGLEQHSFERISVVLEEELQHTTYKDIVVLSGPSHAEEVVRKDLTSITAACRQLESAQYVQMLFSNDFFRIYTNEDVIGVEYGAALKNVIAVGAGVLHGLGFGDNAKAALMTRGLAEISRLGIAFGADPLTFIGLSGVGDLIVTCTSVHSRNWRAGNQIGQGKSVPVVLEQMGMVVEGILTTKAAYFLSLEKGVDMPITTTLYQVLYEEKDVRSAVKELMRREYKAEVSLKTHHTK